MHAEAYWQGKVSDRYVLMKAVLLILFCSTVVLAEAGYYSKAYNLEKEFPLLSVILYEKAVYNENNPKIKQVAVSRLFFLYKKFRKYPEILILADRFKMDYSTQKHLDEIYEKIAALTGLSREELNSVIDLCGRGDDESVKKLSEFISRDNMNANNFILKYLIRKGEFVILEKIFQSWQMREFYPEHYITYLIFENKSGPDDFFSNVENDTYTDQRKAVLYYLRAMYYRRQSDFSFSNDLLAKSYELSPKKYILPEIGKNLASLGQKEPACQPKHLKYLDLEKESDLAFSLYCRTSVKSRNKIELDESLRLQSFRDHLPFYRDIIE